MALTVEDAESGVPDDIRKERRDEVVELVQVKFSTNPNAADDAWSWADLLEERTSARTGHTKPLSSLLARWSASYREVRDGGHKVEAFWQKLRICSRSASGAKLTCHRKYGEYCDMGTPVLNEIEKEFGRLSPEAQLSLLERLVHRVRLAVAGQQDNWEMELSAMAADPEMRRELSQINTEFQVAEADGLERR